MATAEAQRRWREKQRRAKRLAARNAQELTRTFASDALAWATAQPGATARGLALRAAALLDATGEDEAPGTAALRRLAESLGLALDGPEEAAQARRTALGVLESANAELAAGTADIASVRGGLAAARALAKSRPRVNVGTLDRTIQLALAGVYTADGVTHDHGGAPPWSCCRRRETRE